MLSEIIIKYNKAKFNIINKFSDSYKNVCEESLSIDNGYLKSKFEEFQKQYGDICKQIENLYEYGEDDSYNINKINSYIDSRKQLCLETAYLISNDKNNLDLSLKLLDDIETNLTEAIMGIIYYYNGEFNKAKESLYNYYKDLSKLPDHYLINKVYSLILYKEKNYDLSIELMRLAVGLSPDDLDLHIKLREMYNLTGDNISYIVEEQIINMLEEKNVG